MSPTSAWAPASAASASSIACTQAVADVACGDGAAGDEEPERVRFRSRRRRTHRHPAGGCRNGTGRARRGRRRAGRGGSGSTTASVGSAALAAILVAEVQAGDDAVEQPAGEHRHDEVRCLRRAVARRHGRRLDGAHLPPAVGVGRAAGEPAVDLPRLDRRRRAPGRRSPSTTVPLIVIAPGSSAPAAYRASGSARARWRNGPTVCDGVKPAGSSIVALERGRRRAAHDDVEAEPEGPLRARSRRGRSAAIRRRRAAGSGTALKIGSWKNSGSSGKYIWVTRRWVNARPNTEKWMCAGRHALGWLPHG